MLKPVFISDLRGFTRAGKLFGMMSGYLDESFNTRAIVCGGWIASDTEWDRMIKPWAQRIAYESRYSVKRGLSPLSRYHAADCSSRLNEFTGWDSDRQIRFVKRLQDIMAGTAKPRSHRRPMIFGWGVSLKEAPDWLTTLTPQARKRLCYKICVHDCLKEIGRVMREFHTQEKITFFHERGNLFPAAKEAFDSSLEKDSCRDHFVTMADMGWENCVPLQAADMVAYDLLKQIDSRLLNQEQIRRSMQRVVGQGTPIVVGCLKAGSFKLMREWWERDQANGLLSKQ